MQLLIERVGSFFFFLHLFSFISQLLRLSRVAQEKCLYVPNDFPFVAIYLVFSCFFLIRSQSGKKYMKMCRFYYYFHAKRNVNE